MDKKEYFITHIINEKLPSEGFRKVFFYTQTEEGSERYFLGTDNNSYDQVYINEQISLKKIHNEKQQYLQIKQT